MCKEIWKDIPGFEGYQISDTGVIRSFLWERKKNNRSLTPRLISPRLDRSGKYMTVSFRRNKRVQSFYLHRLLYETFVGLIPDGMCIDHKDRNILNNSIDNLRLATRSQNQSNSKKRSDGRTSIYRGVSFYKDCGKWGVMLAKKHIGKFSTELEAAKAYNSAALEKYGEFANLNILPGELN